jgi:hypothetical protein
MYVDAKHSYSAHSQSITHEVARDDGTENKSSERLTRIKFLFEPRSIRVKIEQNNTKQERKIFSASRRREKEKERTKKLV